MTYSKNGVPGLRNAQVSFEFISMLLLAILFTTIIAWSAYYYLTDYTEQRNIKRMQDLGFSLQNEVVLAYNVEPGYSRRVLVPDFIGSYDVNISMSELGDGIILEYKGSEITFRIPKVSGSFSTGYNKISKLSDGSVVIS